MKFLSLLFILLPLKTHAVSLSGKVYAPKECGEDGAMLWLSIPSENFKEKILLFHTKVPQRGSYEFYLKPGVYQLEASTELGCATTKVIEVKEGENQHHLNLEKSS